MKTSTTSQPLMTALRDVDMGLTPVRKGPGRRKGDVAYRTKILRKITIEAIQKGITPLEVMLDNMRYYWKRSLTIQQQIEVMARANEDNPEFADVSGDSELIRLFEKHCEYREKAGVWAIEAAPYTVPKLATVKLNGSVQHDVRAIVASMSMEEAAAAYADSLKIEAPLIVSEDEISEAA